MALIFLEGFDHVLDADTLLKWDGLRSPTIQTGIVRNGRAAAQFTYFDELHKWVEPTDKLTFGGAARMTGDPGNKQIILSFQDSANNHIVSLYALPGYRFRVVVWNVVLGQIIGTSPIILWDNQWLYLELQCYVHASAGTVELKIDGETIISASGLDTTSYDSDATDDLSKFTVYDLDSSEDIYWDDIYVCDNAGGTNDTFLGDSKVITIHPDADGANTGWDPQGAGNHYVEVDETTPDDDTTYNETSVLNDIDTYSFDTVATEPGVIRGAAVNLMLRKIDANERKVRAACRSNGADYLNSSDIRLGEGAYRIYQRMFQVDPDTSAAWGYAAINAAEFGAKVTT